MKALSADVWDYSTELQKYLNECQTHEAEAAERRVKTDSLSLIIVRSVWTSCCPSPCDRLFTDEACCGVWAAVLSRSITLLQSSTQRTAVCHQIPLIRTWQGHHYSWIWMRRWEETPEPWDMTEAERSSHLITGQDQTQTRCVHQGDDLNCYFISRVQDASSKYDFTVHMIYIREVNLLISATEEIRHIPDWCVSVWFSKTCPERWSDALILTVTHHRLFCDGRGQACVRLSRGSRSVTLRHYLQELTRPSKRFLKVRLLMSSSMWVNSSDSGTQMFLHTVFVSKTGPWVLIYCQNHHII